MQSVPSQKRAKARVAAYHGRHHFSAHLLKLVRPGELIKCAQEAGMDKVELQQVLEHVSDGSQGSASGSDSVTADC